MQTFVSRHVPELDGLRGIAILAVLVHHQLTPYSLAGGFLGVDLFFVLSGFLITGLLLAEFEKRGTVSLKRFYMRRVLRLGPALLLYLLACLVVAYHTQLIDFFTELKLVAIALAYATNWRLALGWDRSLDPTAIIWSLSIEEQFYLIWPLLLIACLKFKLSRRIIAFGLGLVIAAIVVNRLWLLNAGESLTRLYYGSDTRADALLVGCLIALLPVRALQSKAKKWLPFAGVGSAIALGYLIVTSNFTDNFLYRGGFTVVAFLAAAVILNAANLPHGPLAILLRLSVLRWFGKISYGLYLWHWLVVRTTSFYYLGYWEPWARLALAVGIAAASFYLIELRFNRFKRHFAIDTPANAPSLKPQLQEVETIEQTSAIRSVTTCKNPVVPV